MKSDQSQTEPAIFEVIDQLGQARREKGVVLSTVVIVIEFCMCPYLLVRLERPIILDVRITKVLHLT